MALYPCAGKTHIYVRQTAGNAPLTWKADRLAAFEHAGEGPKPHSVVFIGGLSDGLATVDYVADLAADLYTSEWSVFNLILSSSYTGWGVGNLDRDVDEIAQALRYVSKYKETSYGPGGKLVIMGHSTGSQDVLQYVYSPNPRPQGRYDGEDFVPAARPAVDGAIIQAPASDREVVLGALPKDRTAYNEAIAEARRLLASETDGIMNLMPLTTCARLGFATDTAISSFRFLSLLSPDSPEAPWPDDLFSSDLTEKRLDDTFGMVAQRGVLKTSFMVLYSGNDAYVPEFVDKEALMQRWHRAMERAGNSPWHAESAVIPGASHAMNGPEQAAQRKTAVQKVRSLLDRV